MRTIPLGSKIPAGVIAAFLRADGILLIESVADYATAPADVQAAYAARPTPEQIAAAEAEREKLAADSIAASSYAKLRALTQMSPAEVQTWVAANVTNLTQAQDAITTLAIAVSVLARRL